MIRAHLRLATAVFPLVIGALLGLPRGSTAQVLEELPEVKSEALPNGLIVLLDPAPEREVVAVQIWYRTGYADDLTPGDAHLIEHLMSEGTAAVPDFNAAMRSVGARTRSATGPELTRFESEVPRAGLDSVLVLEADRMRGLKIDHGSVGRAEKEIAAEEEARAGRRPQSLADFAERVAPFLFGDHPFGPVSGPVTPDRCQAFYEQFYGPERALLVLAGGFDPDRARRAIKTHFGPLAKTGAPARERPPRPALKGEARAVSAPGTPHVVLAYFLPGPESKLFPAVPLVPSFLNVEGLPLVEQICAQAGAPARFLGGTLDETTGLLCVVARPQAQAAPVAEALSSALPLLLETIDAQTFATVRDRSRLAAAKAAASLAVRATARAQAELARSAGKRGEAKSLSELTERDLAALAPELRRERSLLVTIGRDSISPGESQPKAGPPAEDP
jgi:predicted Zn-dependent peptidase